MEDIEDAAKELASTESSLRVDSGSNETRIRLLELTLADAVALLCRVSERLLELENKFEFARLYGFSISAEDE